MIRYHTDAVDAASTKNELLERQVTNITATSTLAGAPLRATNSYNDSQRRGYIRRARHVTYASLSITMLGGVSGIAAAMFLESAAVLGYALESFVDVFSSMLVLWRFCGDGHKLNNDEGAAAGREQIANFGISVSFLVISGVVGQEAMAHIRNRQAPDKGPLLLVVAVVSVLVLSVLCHLKLDLARKLRSESLRKDAITSGAVATLSAAIVVSTAMYSVHPALWWFDSMVALLISFALFTAGLWPLLSTKWWTFSFWAPLFNLIGSGCKLSSPEHVCAEV